MNPRESEVNRERLAVEQAVLHEGAGFAPRRDLTVLVLHGRDRQAFLHGMCTQNIRDLQPGQEGEAFVTNVQGKVVGHILFRCLVKSLELVAAPGQAITLMRHFEKYIIREDVRLTDESSQWRTWDVVGPESPRLLGIRSDGSRSFPTSSSSSSSSEGVMNGGDKIPSGDKIPLEGNIPLGGNVPLGEKGELAWPGGEVRVQRIQSEPVVFQVRVSADRSEEFSRWLTQRELRACSEPAGELWRLEIGFPLYGTDISLDNLPQEVDRDSRAISFTKGCYLGQETVARLDALGHVNRRLMGLLLPGDMPWETGAEIMAEGKVVAKVTSSAHSPRHGCILGLGYIRRGWDQPGKVLETAGGPATVQSIPWRDE